MSNSAHVATPAQNRRRVGAKLGARKPIKEEDGVHEAWLKEAKQIETPEQLADFTDRLMTDYEHDYGTIIHAIWAAMMAAFYCLEHSDQGGITGFQASCLGRSALQEFMGVNGPARVLKFEEMLYPQSAERFAPQLSAESWNWLQEKAAESLQEQTAAHAQVRAHWVAICDGQVPFGWTVKSDG